jgi:hypothetical protein
MKSRWVESGEKRILYIDLSNFGDDIPRFEAEITAAVTTIGQEMYQMPERSALVLVDLRNTNLTQTANKLLSERIVDTKKYVRKTAVVGMTGIRKFFLDYFSRLASSETGSFEEPEAAKDWLIHSR